MSEYPGDLPFAMAQPDRGTPPIPEWLSELHYSKIPPFAHQIRGVQHLVDNPYFFLCDEMGAGKTFQVIAAAQILFVRGIIERVLVVAPSSVRAVWFDPDLSELTKHLWQGFPVHVVEFHQKVRDWATMPSGPFQHYDTRRMQWIITNYEFIRRKNRLNQLISFCGPKTLLVLDESSYIKNHTSEQTKACFQLRRPCGRVILLNGTPIANNPLDLFTQGNMLHPSILDCKFITYFRARYAVMETLKTKDGKKEITHPQKRGSKVVEVPIEVITDWKNLPDLQLRFAPYVLRRLKKDCIDLPVALPPVPFSVPLTDETWATYKAMRDGMVVWLQSGDVSVASQAAVKVMRLSQITSGFLGGIEASGLDESPAVASGSRGVEPLLPGFLESLDLGAAGSFGLAGFGPTAAGNEGKQAPDDAAFEEGVASAGALAPPHAPREISREKLDFFLKQWQELLLADPNLKLLVWCRFKPELMRLMREVNKVITCMDPIRIKAQWEKDPIRKTVTGAIYGGQKRKEREDALRLLDPRTAPEGPVVFGGTYGTGALGINLTASHTVITMSSDYSYWKMVQSAARVDRPGQVHPVSYFDVIATGPKGQKTIDHHIAKALRAKEDVATWTVSAWVKALTDE